MRTVMNNNAIWKKLPKSDPTYLWQQDMGSGL